MFNYLLGDVYSFFNVSLDVLPAMHSYLACFGGDVLLQCEEVSKCTLVKNMVLCCTRKEDSAKS